MAIELVTKYLPYVDEIFKNESKKSLLTNQDFTWQGAKTVKVYKISTAEMNDYTRNDTTGANRFGTPKDLSATTEEMTLKKDRSFTYVIDKMDNDETAGALQGSTSLARQIREVVVPEVDTYTYGIMIANAGTTGEAVAITDENIFDLICTANKTLDEAEVPENGRILLVTPETLRIMKKSKEITLETEIGQEMRLKGVISNLDGASVVKVPANRLPSKFGFMLAHPCATVSPTKLEDYRIHEDPPGISGDLVEGRIVYDAFVLENKKSAIFYQPTV